MFGCNVRHNVVCKVHFVTDEPGKTLGTRLVDFEVCF